MKIGQPLTKRQQNRQQSLIEDFQQAWNLFLRGLERSLHEFFYKLSMSSKRGFIRSTVR